LFNITNWSILSKKKEQNIQNLMMLLIEVSMLRVVRILFLYIFLSTGSNSLG